MNLRTLSATFLALGALLMAGCSNQGPDVIDPSSRERTQASLIAVNSGTDGELVRYSEKSGVVSSNDYTNSNGGVRSSPIDAMYSHGDTLYLHHREAGRISVVDLRTRRKVDSITGFPTTPGSPAGGLNGMAFSNQSQAWVITEGTPSLYHVDLYFHRIAGEIPLPGNPTAVATDSIFIYVAYLLPDGRGQVGMLRSNSGGPYVIEKTFDFPTPVVFMAHSRDALQMYLLTAGSPGGDIKPGVYGLDVNTQSVVGNFDIDAPSLASYVGSAPNFVAMSRNDFMYVAFPTAVLRIDVPQQFPMEWLLGSYQVLDIDPNTDLLYAAEAGTSAIKRVTFEQEQLEDITLSSPVHAIKFVSSTALP